MDEEDSVSERRHIHACLAQPPADTSDVDTNVVTAQIGDLGTAETSLQYPCHPC